MLVKAQASFIRITSRKLMLIAKALKGLSIDKAITSLSFLGRNGSAEVKKVLMQAKANAVNNFKLKPESLKIKEIQIGNGPILKRGRAVSRGMWHPIKKRSSHIRIVLEG